MNDMKLLEDFCAVVPAPEPHRLAAIRATMLAAASSPAVPTRRPRPIRLASSAILAAATAATAAALVVALASGAPSSPAGTAANATQLLRHAAAAALTLPVAAGNQFIYTEGEGTATMLTGSVPHITTGPTVRETQQMWTSVDGSRAGAITMTAPCALLPGGGQPGPPLTYADCHPGISAGSQFTAGLGNYAALQKLPVDPAGVLNYIKSYYAKSYAQAAQAWNPPPQAPTSPFPITETQWDWQQITEAIAVVGLLPPHAGAALFQALALLPGVYLAANVTDYAGQPGIAVAMKTGPSEAHELIFNPASYQFIGTQTVTGGQVTQAYALIKTAIVDNAPPGAAGSSY
jgi:hypothetical protein